MYNINSDVLVKSGFDAADLEEACKEKLAGLGQAFLNAEATTGINALYMIAHAAIESAWGTSEIAVTKNNLFGWNADDSDPEGDASTFSNYEACVSAWSAWLKATYLTPGGAYYEGSTLHDIFVHYSSSHDTEAQSVANIMNELEVGLGGTPAPVAPTEPTPAIPSQHLYVVGSGDTFSGTILNKFPGTTTEEWLDANRSKYSQITADFIEAGWTLTVPEPASAPVAPTEPTGEQYTIVTGDTLWALAEKYNTTTGQLIGWNQSKYPSIGSGDNDLIEAGWTIRIS